MRGEASLEERGSLKGQRNMEQTGGGSPVMRQNAPSATKARLSATLACSRGRALGFGFYGLALVEQTVLRSMGAVNTQEILAMQPSYRRENFVTLNAAESGPRLSVCGADQG